MTTDTQSPTTTKGQRYLARVFVSLKPTVNDPEGATVANALGSLGFEGVERVRSGRYFEVTLFASDEHTASTSVDQMCSRLLANPVIETYSLTVEEAD
ncbi:phosphoribosylformylglycinamidine synthase subunit PurS [bacterium]|nr:phosphoribosylformylglycinamidine synthase subunit PurS [bacterium]